MRLRICSALLSVPLAMGCATAPRGPAGDLAQAGIKATGALSSDVGDLSRRLEYADVTDAFTRTWTNCSPTAPTCNPQLAPDENYSARRDLAKVIRLRARALDALSAAYSALNQEAQYDARADLSGAADAAVSGVNAFASGVARLSGAAPGAAAISEPLGGVLSFGAGLLAERNQRKRIIVASRVIGAATKRMRDALQLEAQVFEESIAEVENERTDARRALLSADLISASDLLKPMADQLSVKFVPNADALLAKSPRARAAVIAAMKAMSRAEVLTIQNRYRSSIAAMDALLAAHADLERGGPVSLADVERTVSDLDAALDRHLNKGG